MPDRRRCAGNIHEAPAGCRGARRLAGAAVGEGNAVVRSGRWWYVRFRAGRAAGVQLAGVRYRQRTARADAKGHRAVARGLRPAGCRAARDGNRSPDSARGRADASARAALQPHGGVLRFDRAIRRPNDAPDGLAAGEPGCRSRTLAVVARAEPHDALPHRHLRQFAALRGIPYRARQLSRALLASARPVAYRHSSGRAGCGRRLLRFCTRRTGDLSAGKRRRVRADGGAPGRRHSGCVGVG